MLTIFTIAGILTFFVWLVRETFIIFCFIIGIIIFLIIVIISAFISPQNLTEEQQEKVFTEIALKYKYIPKFIVKTNPSFDIKRKYTYGELIDLKARFEKDNINVPLLTRYLQIDPIHAKLLLLAELIKQETAVLALSDKQ